jgi:hypothetical protein
VCAAATLERARAAVPGENGLIAYVNGDPGSSSQLFVMNPDGTGQSQISFTGEHSYPAWAPDGLHLTFAWWHFSMEHIWVARADGTDRVQITFGGDHDLRPAWSPDGSSIVFDRENADGEFDVFKVSATGGTPVNLTNHPGRDWDPTWSPDGSKIGFVSSRSPQGIYVMDADGTDQQLLAPGGWGPDWSPDGSRLVFSIATIEPPPLHSPGGPPPPPPPPPPRPYDHLWLVDRDGGNLHQLTYQPDSQYLPSWSPDGSKIAFQGAGQDPNIFVLDLATGGRTQLTFGHNAYPAWQPVVPPPPPPPPPPLPPPPPPQPPPPPPPPPLPPPPAPPPSCVVPRVIGMRLARARNRIRRAKCRVGRVRRVRSRRPRGRIVGQSPAPGRRLAYRTRVNLAVSTHRGA